MHNADATPPADPSPPPLPLPTDLITDVLPPSPPSPAASTGPDNPDPTTQASTIVSSPGPRDVQHAPAAVHTQAGGRAVEKVSPPGPKTQLRELADPQSSTGTSTPAAPHWTPAKVLMAGNIVAVVFLAVIAMLLLSRRGRPTVSHNSAPVLLGDNSQLVPPVERGDADGGYAAGFADARYGPPDQPAR
jgi:hypothetical protein